MEELKNKRIVLLFGAGAARPWGGPSTQDVTDLIQGKIEGDKAGHTDPKVINLIYNFLYYKYSQSSSEVRINFEDIISVIEELILFYYKEEKGSNLILPHFFDLKSDFRDDLESCFSNGKSVYENLVIILKDVLLSITNLVSRYSKNILSSENELDSINLKERIILNNLFNKWTSSIYSDNTYIRAYTLNYDRLFKVLLDDFFNNYFPGSENHEVFEGLENALYEPGIKRILFERDIHCHFNLHGSIFWHMNKYNPFNALEDHHFNSREFPDIPGSNGDILKEIEFGRPFVLSNIIAGYKKSQRSFLTPFKQMHASFEMDCLSCDEVYLIGYSFSDSHVNFGINSGIENNKNCIINIIDPWFKNDSVEKVENIITKFPRLFNLKTFSINSIETIPRVYFEGRLKIYPLTFEDYLKFKNNLK